MSTQMRWDSKCEAEHLAPTILPQQAHVYVSANAAMLSLNQKNMDLFLDVLETLLPDNAVLPKRLTYELCNMPPESIVAHSFAEKNLACVG